MPYLKLDKLLQLDKLNFLIREEYKPSVTYLKRGQLCKKLFYAIITKKYEREYLMMVDKQYIKGNGHELADVVNVTRCLKEWAYLNPRTFVPNPNVLDKYGVKPKEYMFLREVTVGTINYTGQDSGAILGIKDLMPKGMKVLFSLEEKKRRDEYPDDWILLQEPIEDIHSLIYYAAGLVSSGDSMAREAALLGVPAYYLGIRYSMPANAAASKVASLQNPKTMPFAQWIEKVNELRNEGVERLTEEQIKETREANGYDEGISDEQIFQWVTDDNYTWAIEDFSYVKKEVLGELNRELQFFDIILKDGHYIGLQFYVELDKNLYNYGSTADEVLEYIDNEDSRYYFDMCKSQLKKRLYSEINFINKKVMPLMAQRLGLEKYNCVGIFSNGEAIYEKAA